jgi:hypothetical protein
MNLKRNVIIFIGLAAFLASSGLSAQTTSSDAPAKTVETQQKPPSGAAKNALFKSEEEKINYAIGVQLIGNFKRQGQKINLDMVTKGMHDALSGEKLALSDGELRRLIIVYQNAVKRAYAKGKKTEATPK